MGVPVNFPDDEAVLVGGAVMGCLTMVCSDRLRDLGLEPSARYDEHGNYENCVFLTQANGRVYRLRLEVEEEAP